MQTLYMYFCYPCAMFYLLLLVSCCVFVEFDTFYLTFCAVCFVSYYYVLVVHRCCVALPASPVALGTVQVTTTTVRLIWASGDSGPVDPTVSYAITYREVNGNPGTEREVSDILATEYRISGLSVYTTYLFRVVAVNNVGRGLPSTPLEVTTGQLGQQQPVLFSVTFSYDLIFV